MSRKINKDKLSEKLAAFLNMPVEEVKEKAKQLYSYEETVLEMQSVLNFYKARIQPRQGPKEPDAEFDKRYQEWRIKECEGCHLNFAYAYTYDGVKFCSLDCLDGELRKIGLKVTYGRNLKQRWGQYHPAIVPSSALGILQSLPQSQSSDAHASLQQHSSHDESSHPSHLENIQDCG